MGAVTRGQVHGTRSRRPRILAVAACLLLVSLALAPAVAAAEPTFQPATATFKFGQSIDVTQRVALPAGVKRVEALVRPGKDAQTFLSTIQAIETSGETTLRYSYPTPFGGLSPNTPVELGFRVTFEDGTIVDGPTTNIRYQDDRFTWKTAEGTIVRVHWYDGSAGFGRRALEIGERAVQDASTLLGVTETDPIDFYIYADRDKFYDVIGPGLPENVGGIAFAPIRTLFANIAPSAVDDPWVAIVVPHELTHLVFNTAVKNPYHGPLHWLNEGLAVYLSEGFGAGAKSSVDRAGRSGDLMPLRALIGQFPSTADKFSLAYDEAVSAIDYMVRTYGREALVKLIRSYADGVSDDAAFSAALGVDTAGFEAGWLADIGFPAPKPLGPQPAPVGPLPPGWNGSPVGTPGPGASGPVATAKPTKPGDSDGSASVLVYLGIGLVGLLIVAGLVVVAARLSRGEPFLPPMQPEPPRDPPPPPDDP